ncbi:hypothetical protein VPH35_073784 [Triticum aestivum]
MQRSPTGDPSLRPEEGQVVIVATPEMEANAASLESLGAFLWLGGNRPMANTAEIKDAIIAQFGIDRVPVVPHYPEDFFALFEFQHNRDRVTTSSGRFHHAGLDIHSSNWRRDAHSDGIPLYAWSDSMVAQVVGPVTFVHYFDIATLRREDASCLRMWAWSDNPSSIPKVQRVTIAPRVPNVPGGAPSAAIGCRGFRHRAIVHLDRLEDFTPDASGQVPRRPRTDPFTWIYGVVDGEERPRDPLDPPPRHREDDDRHRRDDERDRDDRRGDNDHPPERRADEDRRGDRSGDHGRGRDARARGHDGRCRFCSLGRPHQRDSAYIKPSSGAVDWLRRAAPCFASTPVQPSLNIDSLVISGVQCTPVMALDGASPPEQNLVLGTSLQPVAENALDPTPFPGPSLVLATPEQPVADLHHLVPEAATPEMPEDEATEDATTPSLQRMTLTGIASFNLGRRSPRIRAKNQRLPIAGLAERLLCQPLGIVGEGEQLTEVAISKFVQLCNGRLPDITIAALPVEHALIEHGGEGGPDLGSEEDAEVATTT